MDFGITKLIDGIDDDDLVGIGGDEFYDESDVEEGEVVPPEEQERLYQAYLEGLVDNDGNPIAASQKPSEVAEAAPAPAPAAQPEGNQETSSSKDKDAKDSGISKERIAELHEASNALPSEKKEEFYNLFNEWRDLRLKRNTKRKQKAAVTKAGEILGISYNETLELFEQNIRNRNAAYDRAAAARRENREKKKAAEPVKAEAAEAKPPVSAEPVKAEATKAELPVSAEPVKVDAAEAIKPTKAELPVAAEPVKAESAEAKPPVSAEPVKVDAAEAIKPVKAKPPVSAEAAERGDASEDGNPYVRVTTDGKGRAQLGENASAPSAKWKVEVIDPTTGDPIPFTEDGRSEDYIEGPPLYCYMYLTKMLIPEIAEMLAEQGLTLDTNIRGVVDRTSAMEDRKALAEDKAFDRLLSAINSLKGTKAYRYLTEMKLMFQGPGGRVLANVAPQHMVKQMESHNISLESLGATKAQADELRAASAGATGSLDAIEDRISGRRQSDKYWSDQFEQGLNLGGNFQSMYNYMLMDPNDPTRPSVNAWKNGQPLWEIGWNSFFDNTGPVPVRKKVHPGLDMPFLSADSNESKQLLERLALDGDLSGDRRGNLAKRLERLKKDIEFDYGRFFRKDADLGEGEDKSYVVLQNSDGQTLIPAWDLISKYESTIAKSLGENWARFIRGTGGYKWGGSAGSQRLRQGGDIATAQYNPVLRDLLGRAEAEAPWLARILQSYYLNYGEEPFVPSEEQIAGFMRQLSEKPEEAFAFLTDDANIGRTEGITGFTRRSLGDVSNSLMNILLRPEEAAGIGNESLIEAFNRVSPRSVLAPSDEERVAMFAKKGRKGNGKWGPSQNLMDMLLGSMNVTEKLKSPEWKKLVLRAMMEEAFENPSMSARAADPTGFHLTHHIADDKALGRRLHESEKALEAERDMRNLMVSLGYLSENLADTDAYNDKIAEERRLYDVATDRARRKQSRLALRILDMLMNGDSNLKYRQGFGLVRDIFTPNPKSDSRIKKRVKRRKAVRPSFAESLASFSMAGSVSDAREKEPCSWESWEARRKELIGEDR